MPANLINAPATTMLTSVANARADLGITTAQMSDEVLTRKIKQASDTAADFCNRVFGIATYRETFHNCRYLSSLVLDGAPVVSITSVGLSGVGLAIDQYEVEGNEIFSLGRSGRRCEWFGGSVTVEYVAGWVLPGQNRADYPARAQDLPGSIEKAVMQLISAANSQAGRGDPMLKVSEVEGIGRREYYVQGAKASLPHPEAEAALSRYVRTVLA